MFIAALFTVAKTWKQLKCPSTDEWIRKMLYRYTMEYYSVIKKNKIMPFAATWMELEILILSKVSQKEKDRSSCHGSAATNLTRNHEVAGSIPGLAQWVKDPVLP